MDDLAAKLGATKIDLESISAEEREGKTLLGTAFGESLFHCYYLAGHNGALKRAKWYYLDAKGDHLEVEFYG